MMIPLPGQPFRGSVAGERGGAEARKCIHGKTSRPPGGGTGWSARERFLHQLKPGQTLDDGGCPLLAEKRRGRAGPELHGPLDRRPHFARDPARVEAEERRDALEPVQIDPREIVRADKAQRETITRNEEDRRNDIIGRRQTDLAGGREAFFRSSRLMYAE
jgi:hypothetical protein